MKQALASIKQVGYITLALTIALAANFAYGQWAEPTGAPPTNNIAAPVNVGGDAQIKTGDLSANKLIALDSLIDATSTVSEMRADKYCDYLGENCLITANMACLEGQILKVVGGEWACAEDGDGTFVGGTGPFLLDFNQINSLAKQEAGIVGSGWAVDPDPLSQQRICELHSIALYGVVGTVNVLSSSEVSSEYTGSTAKLGYSNGTSWTSSVARSRTCTTTDLKGGDVQQTSCTPWTWRQLLNTVSCDITP